MSHLSSRETSVPRDCGNRFFPCFTTLAKGGVMNVRAVIVVIWLLAAAGCEDRSLYETMQTGLPNGDGPRIDSDGFPCSDAMERGDYDTALRHVKRLQRRAHLRNEEQRYFAMECIWGVAADLQNDLEEWKKQGKRIERGSSLDQIITITIKELRLSKDWGGSLLPKYERLVKEVGCVP